jgi:hypothetical protein
MLLGGPSTVSHLSHVPHNRGPEVYSYVANRYVALVRANLPCIRPA